MTPPVMRQTYSLAKGHVKTNVMTSQQDLTTRSINQCVAIINVSQKDILLFFLILMEKIGFLDYIFFYKTYVQLR